MSETRGLTAKMAKTKQQVKRRNNGHVFKKTQTRNLLFDLPKGVRRMVLDLALRDAQEAIHRAHTIAMTSDVATWLEKRRGLKRTQRAFQITAKTRQELYDK